MSKRSVTRKLVLVAACVFLAMTSGFALAQSAVFSADAVKAAFLYRFASYVEWPPEAHGAPFVIAVVDAENVASQLDLLLPRTNVNGQPAQVRRVSRVSELEGVHILYVAPNAFARSRALRSAAQKLPILLVTEDERGLESGAIINFVEAGRNVRFEVSLEASDRARLKINSALLSVAARVERRPQAWAPCAEPAVRPLQRSGCRIRMAAAAAATAR